MQSSFPFLKKTCQRTNSVGEKEMVQKSKIIGLHQANKMTKQIDKTTKKRLRTKAWKDSSEASSLTKKCGWKKVLNGPA